MNKPQSNPNDPKIIEATISDLIPDMENGNDGTEIGRFALEKSIDRLGLGRGIVIDRDNRIIAGNKTHEVAGAIGLNKVLIVPTTGDTLVVTQRVDLDLEEDDRARELAWADNRVGQLSFNPNIERLIEDAQRLDMGYLYTDQQVQELIAKHLEPEEPEEEELPEGDGEKGAIVSRVEPGECWKVGRHLIYCGDSRQAMTWQSVFGYYLPDAHGMQAANLCFTSPPYAEQREYDKDSGFEPIPAEKYSEWFHPVQYNLQEWLTEDGSFLLNIKEHNEDFDQSDYVLELVLAHRHWGWSRRDTFIWSHSGTPGDPKKMGKLKNQYEPIYWFYRNKDLKFRPDAVMHFSDQAVLVSPNNPGLKDMQGKKGVMTGEVTGEGLAYPGNVLKIAKNTSTEDTGGHSAVFPVDLPSFFIRLMSDPGDVIVDPFGGSGSTLVACEKNDRIGVAIELSPLICESAIRRLERECKAIAERL